MGGKGKKVNLIHDFDSQVGIFYIQKQLLNREMLKKELSEILNGLGKMKEHELAMAEFYRTFGEVWLAEKEFWLDMEKAERRHAQYLDRVIQCLTEKPDHFHLGRPLRLAAIQTSLSGIQSAIDKLKKKQKPLYKLLFTARDMEQSIIESKVGEYLRTDDIECRSLLEEMVSDTESHLERLVKKIKEWSR